MKKNIELITLDRNLTQKLSHFLGTLSDDGASELSKAFDSMLNGTSETLLLSMGEIHSFNGDAVIRCSDVSIYPSTRRVTRGDQEISLTPKEFDILCLLARNRGQVFTKEQIYQEVWDENFIMDSSNIMAFIRKLRKKLEPDADQPRYILTVWGLGYKFNDKD